MSSNCLNKVFVCGSEQHKKYLKTRVSYKKDGKIEITQPCMIEQCLETMDIDPNSNNTEWHDKPAEAARILQWNKDRQPRKQNWNYRAAVGSLKYLHAMARPNILYVVYQCTYYCNHPILPHKQALKRIGCYLLGMNKKGLVMNPI